MDIFCPKCGEPWDTDTLHEYVKEWRHLGTTYADVRSRFQREGCGNTFAGWRVKCEPVATGRAEMARAVYALLGDDLDGAAATFEDFGGGFD